MYVRMYVVVHVCSCTCIQYVRMYGVQIDMIGKFIMYILYIRIYSMCVHAYMQAVCVHVCITVDEATFCVVLPCHFVHCTYVDCPHTGPG